MTGLSLGSTPAPPRARRAGRGELPCVSVAGASRVKWLRTPQYWLTMPAASGRREDRVIADNVLEAMPGPIDVRACLRTFNHHSSQRMHLYVNYTGVPRHPRMSLHRTDVTIQIIPRACR